MFLEAFREACKPSTPHVLTISSLIQWYQYIPLPADNTFWSWLSPRKHFSSVQFLIEIAFWPVYQFAVVFLHMPPLCFFTCITTHNYAGSDFFPQSQFLSCMIPMYYKLVHIGVLLFSPAGGSGAFSCSRLQTRQEHSTRGRNLTSTLTVAHTRKTSNRCTGVPESIVFCHSLSSITYDHTLPDWRRISSMVFSNALQLSLYRLSLRMHKRSCSRNLCGCWFSD